MTMQDLIAEQFSPEERRTGAIKALQQAVTAISEGQYVVASALAGAAISCLDPDAPVEDVIEMSNAMSAAIRRKREQK